MALCTDWCKRESFRNYNVTARGEEVKEDTAAKHRLQFNLNEDALRELDTLREETGLPTRAELIRHALKFLQWTLEETKKKDATLLIEKNGKAREVVFPFWTVTKSGHTQGVEGH